MPIEIRELVIKATVSPNEAGSSTVPGAGGGNTNNNISPTEEIVNLCVEKIIEILKTKNER